MEIIVVMGLMVLVLSIVGRPAWLILQYPSRHMLDHQDRVSGLLLSRQIRSDLKRAYREKVWVKNYDNGDQIALLLCSEKHQGTDSSPKSRYVIWFFRKESLELYSRSWTIVELADANLPAPTGPPTESQWNAFKECSLRPKGSYVENFNLDLDKPDVVTVAFALKHPNREGTAKSFTEEVFVQHESP